MFPRVAPAWHGALFERWPSRPLSHAAAGCSLLPASPLRSRHPHRAPLPPSSNHRRRAPSSHKPPHPHAIEPRRPSPKHSSKKALISRTPARQRAAAHRTRIRIETPARRACCNGRAAPARCSSGDADRLHARRAVSQAGSPDEREAWLVIADALWPANSKPPKASATGACAKRLASAIFTSVGRYETPSTGVGDEPAVRSRTRCHPHHAGAAGRGRRQTTDGRPLGLVRIAPFRLECLAVSPARRCAEPRRRTSPMRIPARSRRARSVTAKRSPRRMESE